MTSEPIASITIDLHEIEGLSCALEAAQAPNCRLVTMWGFGGAARLPTRDGLAAQLDALASCPVPVIAVVAGEMGGVGTLLAAAADIVIAERHARFSLDDLPSEILPLAVRLCRLLPAGVVRRLVLTGEKLGAEDAARLGGVIRVVAGDALEPTLDEISAGLLSKSPMAVRLLKQAMATTLTLPIDEGLDLESLYSRISAITPDGREAVSAFLERRKPVWGIPT